MLLVLAQSKKPSGTRGEPSTCTLLGPPDRITTLGVAPWIRSCDTDQVRAAQDSAWCPWVKRQGPGRAKLSVGRWRACCRGLGCKQRARSVGALGVLSAAHVTREASAGAAGEGGCAVPHHGCIAREQDGQHADFADAASDELRVLAACEGEHSMAGSGLCMQLLHRAAPSACPVGLAGCWRWAGMQTALLHERHTVWLCACIDRSAASAPPLTIVQHQHDVVVCVRHCCLRLGRVCRSAETLTARATSANCSDA